MVVSKKKTKKRVTPSKTSIIISSASGDPDPIDVPDVIWGGGRTLTRVEVQVIFWGSWWLRNDTFRGKVISAVSTILTGSYMTELQQYGGIQKGKLSDILPKLVINPVGNSSADPPPIFGRLDVENLISNLVQSGTVSDPRSSDQLLYAVFLPPGSRYEYQGRVGDRLGDHTFFVDRNSGRKIYYALVTNDGTLDSITSCPKLFSHELVEACTDPEPDKDRGGTPGYVHDYVVRNGQKTNDEIADNCEHQYTLVNDVAMQHYWSKRHKNCVLPTPL